MKKILIYAFILTLILSCKDKITKVKIIATENDKNYKCFMINYGERPTASVKYECSWIKNPENTVFLYMPVSFKLENKTGRNLRISQIWDSFNSDTYQPVFIDNKYYNDINDKLVINSGDITSITLFVHMPVSTDLLDKKDFDRYFRESNNRKPDSIVMNNINIQLQKEIDKLLKKKQIYISYHENKNLKENAIAYYCVDKQQLGVFKSDSLAKLKTTFKYNCD